ncbi:MAG: hypothetical protein IPF94_20630 [Betaproteobacteria bacterium]|nr:hypothetical protein [Betaproteobacteria bacterium]
MADASLLKRALGNLVDNASAYGGSATVRVQDSADRLELQVLDDGPGTPRRSASRSSSHSSASRPSRSRATGGTGLGLGISRNIVRSHGGDLVLRNRPEGGLAAVLTLAPRGRILCSAAARGPVPVSVIEQTWGGGVSRLPRTQDGRRTSQPAPRRRPAASLSPRSGGRSSACCWSSRRAFLHDLLRPRRNHAPCHSPLLK